MLSLEEYMKFNGIRHLIKEGFRSIWANRLMSLASVGVLMSCLIVIGCAVLFSANVDKFFGGIEDKNVINIYLQDTCTEQQIEKVKTQAMSISNVEQCIFVSKEQAFENQKKDFGDKAALLDGLKRNPLPDAFKIVIKDMALYDDTTNALRNLDYVEEISDNSKLASQLSSIRQVITVGGFGIIAILLLISLFIISNTVKLTMYGRRLEINIMKSVGATNSYVRFPFVIEGIILGVISALGSYGVIYYVYKILVDTVRHDFQFKDVVAFNSLALYIVAGFLIIGVFMGLFGSMISMRKYLRREGSEFNAI